MTIQIELTEQQAMTFAAMLYERALMVSATIAAAMNLPEEKQRKDLLAVVERTERDCLDVLRAITSKLDTEKAR